jgi:hypothetical protein
VSVGIGKDGILPGRSARDGINRNRYILLDSTPLPSKNGAISGDGWREMKTAVFAAKPTFRRVRLQIGRAIFRKN